MHAPHGITLAPGVLAQGHLEHPPPLCNNKMGVYQRSFAIGTGDTFPYRQGGLGGMPGWCGDPIPRLNADEPVSNFTAGGTDWGCESQETYREGGV